ncbi:MAG: CpsD/CapB family tyrosine-protein kinase [Planctomycetota bacterium]
MKEPMTGTPPRVDVKPAVAAEKRPARPRVDADAGFQTLSDPIERIWAKTFRKNAENEPQRLIVVSPHAGAGNSTVASCIALGLSRHTRSTVLLVEANLVRPAIARYFGMPLVPGLRNVLEGSVGADQMLRATKTGLTIVPAGAAKASLAGEFAGRECDDFFALARRQYRHIVIDAPPPIECPETRLLFRQAERCVVVVQGRQTSIKAAKQMVELLEESGMEILGTILNDFVPDAPAWMFPSRW